MFLELMKMHWNLMMWRGIVRDSVLLDFEWTLAGHPEPKNRRI